MSARLVGGSDLHEQAPSAEVISLLKAKAERRAKRMVAKFEAMRGNRFGDGARQELQSIFEQATPREK